MSSDDIIDFAMLAAVMLLDEEQRREHARSVVVGLGLDPRLEPLIPMRPSGKKKIKDYEELLAGLKEISEKPEPERTKDIEYLGARFG
ncbi:MAG: hypothetical protein RQ731_08485 [Anaerosomatales bacterium]|nr:hypothetical protein [Anaerosomatales bacterium]MDT8434775.1 hypothetical protein [Anaerosomatales bacterium]